MLEKIKILIGLDGSKDTLLNTLIDLVKQEFLDYCNREEIPESAEAVLIQMVICQYNRLGAQGINSQSFSGISESFIDGYPANIKKQLNRYRKIITL